MTEPEIPDEPSDLPRRNVIPVRMSVHRSGSKIILTFTAPTRQFTMNPTTARQMADQLHILAVEAEFRNQ